MSDQRIARLAHLLVDYSVNVQPGERVAIVSEPVAAPLVLLIYERVLERGGYADLSLSLPGMEEIFYRTANADQIAHISPLQRMIYEEYEALISIRAATNTRELTGVDPARQVARRQALAPILEQYMARGASGDLKWNATLFPTRAYAQEADMSLRDYENFVYGACFCDRDDPISEWQRIHREQARVIDWLEGRENVHVVGANVDLELSVKGRTFVNSDGKHNMPSGEIFTGPVEDSANGWVHFTYPAVTAGREVDGIDLVFEEGRVVEAHAKKNEAYLLRMLDTDEGARYLGEFAVGTNFGIRQFTKNILFDEKIGGSFHLAVGAGYPDTGSENRSAVHWDMICDMREDGEIWVDGDLMYQQGKFII
jgi:aminopeptidase